MNSKKLWKLLFLTTEGIRNLHFRSSRQCQTSPELTMSQLRVLSCVFLCEAGRMKVKEIADELGITPGAVSQNVDRLVKLELLTRELDESDRRAVCIALSPKGQDIHDQISRSFDELSDDLTANIPPEKIAVFAEVLQSILAGLERKKSQLKEQALS